MSAATKPRCRQAGLLAAGAWLAGVPAAVAAAPCVLGDDAGTRVAATADAPVQLAWRADPAALAVGRPFALRVTVCPQTARLRRVDAAMPEHRHGMNYRPSITALGPGRWRAEGLLWHMAGRWELSFEVEADGAVQTLRQSLTLR